jgi:hypothetical protein
MLNLIFLMLDVAIGFWVFSILFSILSFIFSTNKRDFIIGFLSITHPGLATSIYGSEIVRNTRRR